MIATPEKPTKIDPTSGETLYPCLDCDALRTRAEGGTVFTVCDACWNATNPYRSTQVTVDRGVLSRALAVMQELGAVSSGWWPRVYSVRDELCDALGEPRIARPTPHVRPISASPEVKP